MDKIGQEFLPACAASARDLGGERPLERHGRQHVPPERPQRRDLCLGMTHEEVMTEIARKELRSYKQLPQIWYQIQTKFRDEPRPKSGLLRVRQFTMKDAYSFDIDAAGLDVCYQKHYDAYCQIFDRCGLKYVGGRGALGRDGRLAVARVHGLHRRRRRLDRELREVRLRGESGEGHVEACHRSKTCPGRRQA